MKQKINRYFILIALISTLATLLLVMSVFYQRFQNQVFVDLEMYAHLVSTQLDDNSCPVYEGYRITLINNEGHVLCDSHVTGEVENHADRPEFIQAMKQQEGWAIRASETLQEDSFYYALQISNNRILRVSTQASSFTNIFMSTLPGVFIMSVFIFGILMLLASYLTRSIIQPIDDLAINLAHPAEPVYKELKPFVDRIRLQHEDVLKNAQMRQDFTANVSHELKTPLTSISGYSELIENGMASEEDIQHFAHEIHKSASRLLTSINDIIRLSELDSDVQESFEMVDLYECAFTVITALKMQAEKYMVKLQLKGEKVVIFANREMMMELIGNLVDNAIRYNKKNGFVTVTVEPYGAGALLSVKDTGIGIPKEYQQRIFERFYRVDKSRSKETGGTGLGLAIVKHIVLKHQALLQVVSETNQGCEMIVTFRERL